MTTLILLALVAAMLLAFANGANDNAKGVATLIGSGTMSQRTALIYAAATTLAGSVAAIWLAGVLLEGFTGKGIVDQAVVNSGAFAVTVALAAGLTVLAATRLAMPISTTHALVGAMVGVGLSAGALNGSAVWTTFFIPLLASPLLALLLAAAVYGLFRTGRRLLGISRGTCVCVGQEYVPVNVTVDGAMTVQATGLTVRHDQVEQCREVYAGRVVGIEAQRVLDIAHIGSAGLASFARGLNDTPKIAALLLAAGSVGLQPATALLAVGVGIAAGGLLAVRRVARTMSYQITEMNDGQAFSANLVTAVLVCLATLKFGVPVSTTHTSCGSLFGIGLINRRAHWPVIGKVLLAWVVTLPVAATIGYIGWHLVSYLA